MGSSILNALWATLAILAHLVVLAPGATGQLECATESFCSAVANSSGSPAHISSGSCLPSGTELELNASPVPGDFGLFFYSTTTAGGGAGVPFGDGLRCVGGGGGALYRLPVRAVTGGQLTDSLDLSGPPTLSGPLLPGSTWFLQAWFRDPAAGGSGFNLSDGLEVSLRPARPRVLHIIVDDVGMETWRAYHDQNAYDGDPPFNQLEDPEGSNLYPWTPVLDSLVSRGVRFDQFRTNPTCSTTRANMLTGRYAFRHGIGSLVAEGRVGAVGELGVGPGNDEFTLPLALQPGGYRSGWVGKWHLALPESQVGLGGLPGQGYPHILEVGGFDEAWGLIANLDGPYHPPPVHIPGVSGSIAAEDDVLRGFYNYYSWATFGPEAILTENWIQGAHATGRTLERTRELISQLELTDASKPWYVVASLSAAHSPYGDVPDPGLVTTLEYLPAVTPYGLTIPGGTGVQTLWRGHNQLLESLDAELGAFFESLGGLDQVLESTMVILTSDNGTISSWARSAILDHGKDIGSVYSQLYEPENNHFKHNVYELGTRVPMVVAGPLVADPGRASSALVDAVDLHATIAAIGAVAVEDSTDGRTQDGVSFLPVLTGQRSDLQQLALGRRFSLTERFSPNGDPRAIQPPISNERSRRRGFLANTSSGWCKLVRRLGPSGEEVDELYHLYSGALPGMEEAVDPFELNDLRQDPAYLGDYLELVEGLEALLATEL